MRNTRHNKQNETQNEMKRNEMSQKSEIEIKKQLNFSPFRIDIQYINIYELRPQRAKWEMCFTRWQISKNKLIKITRTCRRLLCLALLLLSLLLLALLLLLLWLCVLVSVCVFARLFICVFQL